MAVNSPSLPIAKSWSYSHLIVRKLELKWNIDVSECLKKLTGEFLESSPFSTDANDELKWCLQLYPNGYSEKYKGCFSLFLILKSKPRNRSNVSAHYKFRIPNGYGKETYIEKSATTGNIMQGETWGFNEFCNRYSGVERLVKGQVEIICKIQIFDDDYHNNSNNVRLKELDYLLSEHYQNLFLNEKFSDVTLSVGDREFRAHKAILSARSDVFAAMFKHEMEEKNLNNITISDIDYDIVKEMLHFIYTDKAPNLDKVAFELLPAADKYALEKLKVMCENMLYSSLSVETAIKTLILADHHNADQLKAQTVEFINKRYQNILKTEDLQTLITTYPNIVSDLFQAVGMVLPQIRSN